jgi:hypothetical protein
MEFAGVVALEIIGQRRARHRVELRALPDPKPSRPRFVIEDGDGRTQVFTPPGVGPQLGCLSSGLMSLKARHANRSATRQIQIVDHGKCPVVEVPTATIR